MARKSNPYSSAIEAIVVEVWSTLLGESVTVWRRMTHHKLPLICGVDPTFPANPYGKCRAHLQPHLPEQLTAHS